MAEDALSGETPAPRVVFLVGAPRSGTTWLQSLLGSHPAVVTPQETDLFSTFVAPLQEWWDRELERSPVEHQDRRNKGLPAVLDDDDFTELVSGLVARVLAAIHALDPATTVIVEKSPSHSRHVALIARYLPEAAFIHLVRDGRDVVASLQSASRGWGGYWAPSALKRATAMWATNVRGAQGAARTGRYTEVRYEQLRAGAPEPLQRAFAVCGLTVEQEACAALLEQYSLERMTTGAVSSPIVIGGSMGRLGGDRREPTGFYGRGRVGGWAETWAPEDRLLFDALAGDLLVELGYEPDRAWAGSARRRAWYARRAAIERLAGKGGRRIGRRITRRSEQVLARLP